MGIFDAILGLNTAKATNAASQEGQSLFNAYNFFGNQALNNTTNDANSALRAGAGDATGALTSALAAGRSDLTGYGSQAQGTLGSGIDRAASTSLGGNAAYAPYATSGQAASGALSDALGLNGAAGNARATTAFQAAPGYQYTVNQSTDAASRAAAAAGMGASGNTLDAVSKIAGQLGNQGFQQYLGNLGGLGGQGLTAAAGMSGNNNAAAGLYGTGATTGATLQQDTGTKLGALGQALGLGQANVDQNLGTNLSGNFTNLGQNIANVGLNTAKGVSGLAMDAGKAQDSATNANNGLLSKQLGTLFAPVTGQLSNSLGGLFSRSTNGFL